MSLTINTMAVQKYGYMVPKQYVSNISSIKNQLAYFVVKPGKSYCLVKQVGPILTQVVGLLCQLTMMYIWQ